MRTAAVGALAALLFLGGFAAVRAQSDDVQRELERLEAAVSRLVAEPDRDSRPLPERLAPLQAISVAGLQMAPPWRQHPRIGEPADLVREAYVGPWLDGAENPLTALPDDLGEFVNNQLLASGSRELSMRWMGIQLLFRGTDADRMRVEALLDRTVRPAAMRTVLIETRWSRGFEGRHLAAANARSLFWVGRQRAILADPDVASTGAPHGVTDPYIEAMHLGETLLVLNRPSPRGVQLEFSFESRREEPPMRRVATRHSGMFDQPRYRETLARPQAHVPPGAWTAIHRGAGGLSVRVHVLERGDR